MIRPDHLKNERGSALIATAVALVALVAVTAVGVDLGHLAFIGTEVQNLADIAASAGAKAVVEGRNPQSNAVSLVGQNSVDGHQASEGNLQSLVVGRYSNGAFNPGGVPANAVKATATATTAHLLAGILPALAGGSAGTNTSRVTKVATASYASLGGGNPQLPIAISDAAFTDPNCLDDSCLPHAVQAPNTVNNSGFTGFFGGTGTSDILALVDCSGDSGVIPYVSLGDDINLTNGQLDPVLKAISDCVDAGHTDYLIPVVANAGFNQSSTVLGFATLHITAVVASGNPKYIQGNIVFNPEAPGPPNPGGTSYGTGSVVLACDGTECMTS